MMMKCSGNLFFFFLTRVFTYTYFDLFIFSFTLFIHCTGLLQEVRGSQCSLVEFNKWVNNKCGNEYRLATEKRLATVKNKK